MGKRSRDKGCRGEREAAAEIARIFGVEARRGRQYCGDQEAPDVRTAIAGIHFEVKRCERLRLYQSIGQAAEDAGSNIPIVLHKANRREWLAIIRLADLPALVERLAAIQHPPTQRGGSTGPSGDNPHVECRRDQSQN